jgi:hypothetical protein
MTKTLASGRQSSLQQVGQYRQRRQPIQLASKMGVFLLPVPPNQYILRA